MTTTLLAVDDSKTMRKVLEITFAGEDYRAVLAESSAEALAKLRSDNPAVALVDAQLGDESGYDLCQQIKRHAPSVGVLILSSRQQPYDRARGTNVGVDDFVEKPFDTQQLLDKVAALLRRGVEAPLTAAKAAPAAAPAARPQTSATAPGLGVRPVSPAANPAASPAAKPAMSPAAGVRPLSVSTGGQQSATSPIQPRPVVAARPAATAPAQVQPPVRPPSSPQAAPPPAPAAGRPAAPAASPAAPAAPAPAAAVGAVVASAPLPADLERKLAGLGLTKDQVSGVLALSKDVVEKVVWEVVPMLAEVMIKEEIKRLTSD